MKDLAISHEKLVISNMSHVHAKRVTLERKIPIKAKFDALEKGYLTPAFIALHGLLTHIFSLCY